MSEFEGKVAVVTGAAGNLGAALSAALARAGSRIALLDRDEDALARARSDLPQGADAEIFVTDLIDPAAVRSTVAAVEQHFGRIDILANVAGGFTMGPALADTDDATWDFMMDLNARSVFNMCRAVLPLMQKTAASGSGGRIINVSARHSARP
jgi:NAD(P)-dependent dehydrogenase (short-subunit alcohol dehydrogenase family)